MEVIKTPVTSLMPITNAGPVQGATVPNDFVYVGPKLYSDTTWKKQIDGDASTAGLGVYFHIQEQQHHTDVFILANAPC
jgi:hypothetical protein